MNGLEICKICNEPVLTLAHFWKKHKIKLESYILQYFPKYDLFDRSALLFKTSKQYFGCDFNNKNNLKTYLKQVSKENAIDYCKTLLIRRKEYKQLVYTPCQIELASLSCFPPVHYLLSLFDYYEFCNSIGLINKVSNINNFDLKLNDFGNNEIIIDSRENNPLKFDFSSRISKLDFGDYFFTGNNLYFERKSLPDFIGTLTSGLERFTKELERANKAGAYLIMIVENKLSDCLSFNHLPWMKRIKTKATPEYIFHNLRGLIQRFPRFQPLFVDGRKLVVEYIMKGSLSGETFCEFDLQLLYQLNLI